MFSNIIGAISGFMYSKLLIILLLGGGIYFTVATKFIQGRMFKEAISVIGEKPTKEGAVSSFQALMVLTASRVGTGNIVGVASAIGLGGYGAVFWMWLIAIVGGASAFVESTLAQIYKKKDDEGNYYGGPAYYIEAALHSRALAFLFAFSMLLTYAGGFNMLCAYNLQSTFSAYSFYDPKVSPIIIGAILAIIFGYCLLGGGKRIVKTTSTLVPIMGILYVLVSLFVLLTHANLIPEVFARIFAEAFDFQAIFGGFAGSCVMFGIKRGLYSNEAGVGSAPNAAAAADVSHPVKQGLVQMLSVFIDTLLLCSATALMCLCSGIEPNAEIAGAPYVQEALRTTLGDAGPIFITVAMILFAFTTLIGNIYYTDNLLAYMMKKVPSKSFMFGFRIVCSIIVFVGAISKMGLLWDISDVLMGIMAIINIPVILILHSVTLGALSDYTKQKQEGKNPVFKASTVGLEGKVDCWK
ncbi:alanine/glycine:cation symporter family protein [Moryella indoligenes]|uniref:alanine/glycine:cation symporter family protein n=1 Tax=Moryella indoligenes TaxID=371674 RepID=UPI0027D79C5F|nr:alanine/glycine:cation symporter family protein [Moryella indoligenes]